MTDRQDRKSPPAPGQPELSRPLPIEKLAGGDFAIEVGASAAECLALAQRFGFRRIEALNARVAVGRRAGGLIRVEGRLRAQIVQDCVLSLEPVPQAIDEAFRLDFAREKHAEGREGGEILLSAAADAPEPLEGSSIDIGEIVAEQLALLADPYPRRAGVSLADVLAQPAPRQRKISNKNKPFAALRKLREGKS